MEEQIKKFRESLKEFDGDVIGRVLTEIQEGAHCFKNIKEFSDPGPAVKVGEESRVELEDLVRLEQLIYPENNLLPVHFLEEGAIVQKAVGRVTLLKSHEGLPKGSGWGTGFLVSPSLFMTNHHVIKKKDFARDVAVQFNYQLDFSGVPQQVDQYATDPDDEAFYPHKGLDFTLIRLKSKREAPHFPYPHGGEAMGYHTMPGSPSPYGSAGGPLYETPQFFTPGSRWGFIRLNASILFAKKQHVNIIQHPAGRRKEVAIQHNQISKIFTERIHYETDTEPGSSGSPVFDNGWNLIALHHAAGSTGNIGNKRYYNEGMRIDKIVAQLRKYFGSRPGGRKILDEMGI